MTSTVLGCSHAVIARLRETWAKRSPSGREHGLSLLNNNAMLERDDISNGIDNLVV